MSRGEPRSEGRGVTNLVRISLVSFPKILSVDLRRKDVHAYLGTTGQEWSSGPTGFSLRVNVYSAEADIEDRVTFRRVPSVSKGPREVTSRVRVSVGQWFQVVKMETRTSPIVPWGSPDVRVPVMEGSGDKREGPDTGPTEQGEGGQ